MMAAAMTRNPFARIEQRINSTMERRLANAVATWQDGEPFGVIFQRTALGMLDVVGGYAVSCSLLVDRTPGISKDSVLVIDGKSWRVCEPVEPDQSGWATLQLAEVLHD